VKKNKITDSKRMVDHYILISENELLKEELEKLLGKNVKVIPSSFKNELSSLLKGINTNIEIIFDQNYLTFSTIISAMELYKNEKVTFKIIANHSNFMIGSNSSNDRGEVVMIEG
jgi:hypothetical protein